MKKRGKMDKATLEALEAKKEKDLGSFSLLSEQASPRTHTRPLLLDDHIHTPTPAPSCWMITPTPAPSCWMITYIKRNGGMV